MSGPWAVTGTGLVTAAGDSDGALFDSLVAGTPVEIVESGGLGPTAPIPDFDVQRYVKRKGITLLSRTSRLACAAASGLVEPLNGIDAAGVGVVFGSAWATLDTIVRFEWEAQVEGPRFVDPILFTETVANVPAGQVSISFGWAALNATVAAGTASGLEAVRRATEFLDDRRAIAIVAGGGDELSAHLVRALAADRPGQAGRVAYGEAACFIGLESLDGARARGGRIQALLLGAGSTFVGSRCPAAAGAALVGEVLDRSDTEPAEVDVLVSSCGGEATAWENAIVHELFGDSAPPAVVPRTVIGETWAASGPLGLVVAGECLRRKRVPGAPRGLSPSLRALDGIRLPQATIELDARRALVLECSATGHVAAAVVSAVD